MNPEHVRLQIRKQQVTGTTSGMCDHYVQTNLVTLPKAYAFDFLLFCYRNPKPCPIIDILEAGQVSPSVAPSADIRSDVPKYRIYNRDGRYEEAFDVTEYWRDDFVTFLLGCSFTFERALNEAGIPLRHQEQEKVVPMYKTTIPLDQAGPFEGNMVVSMRPIPKELVEKAVSISKMFDHAHGEPVHIGDPQEIGIEDMDKVDYGESVDFDDETHVPVFWACGVTPQNVLINAGLPIVITHAPGHMFITDEWGK